MVIGFVDYAAGMGMVGDQKWEGKAMDTRDRLEAVAMICGEAIQNLNEVLPNGQGKQMALMKVQEAAMWASSAVIQADQSEIEVPVMIIKPN